LGFKGLNLLSLWFCYQKTIDRIDRRTAALVYVFLIDAASNMMTNIYI